MRLHEAGGKCVMRYSGLYIAIALLASACGAPSFSGEKKGACMLNVGSTVAPTGVGDIRVGMGLRELVRRCPGIKIKRDSDGEGIPVTLARVPDRVGAIEMTLEGDRVVMIRVADKRIGDRRGNRPGSPFKVERGSGVFATEEDGRLFVQEAGSCALSYATDYIPGDDQHRGTWSIDDIRRLRMKVIDIRAAGCS
jgi:hypothetical protein